ncbi:MAG TPA: ABC transporter permease [Lachnospiraceae bacterium]|nr:ABC transporter permease [Lachnospiraceae bacterium]
MQVYSGYLKILKKSLRPLGIYFGIFMAVLILYSANATKPKGNFEATKVNTTVINYEEDSVLIDSFLSYMGNYCEFVDVNNDKEELDDALFIRKIDYIITIDKGFEDRFLEGKTVSVDKRSVPNSQDSFYVDSAINNYFNTFQTYRKSMPNATIEELCKLTTDTLMESTTINLIQDKNEYNDNAHYDMFYNFLSYLLIASFISCIGSIMLTFNDLNIRRKNVVSPISSRRINLQMMLANFVFAIIFYAFIVILGFVMSPERTLSLNLLLYVLNGFAFLLCALSISYIVGLTTRSSNAIGGISTIISLGLAFVSGAFVPQFLLGESVLRIARFTPNYWYVYANDKIAETSDFTTANLTEIFGCMGIEVAFALALAGIALVIGKKKSQKEF